LPFLFGLPAPRSQFGFTRYTRTRSASFFILRLPSIPANAGFAFHVPAVWFLHATHALYGSLHCTPFVFTQTARRSPCSAHAYNITHTHIFLVWFTFSLVYGLHCTHTARLCARGCTLNTSCAPLSFVSHAYTRYLSPPGPSPGTFTFGRSTAVTGSISHHLHGLTHTPLTTFTTRLRTSSFIYHTVRYTTAMPAAHSTSRTSHATHTAYTVQHAPLPSFHHGSSRLFGA